MGQLSFYSQDIPVTGPDREVVEETMSVGEEDYQVTAATIGNPHCVIFVDKLSAALIRAASPLIEVAPSFPKRINVQFVKIIDRQTIQIEIWERGAGYTLASGTSACATAGAAIRTGRCDSPVQVQMAGGAATVAIDENWRVTLTGQVEAVGWGNFAGDFVAKLGVISN
jgi:diaminopimelate epimerase